MEQPALHTATIQVKKVWPVFKPGDKRTNIDDMGGIRWRVEAGKASSIVEGVEYDVGYTEETFNGNAYHLIKNITPHKGAPTPLALGEPVAISPVDRGKQDATMVLVRTFGPGWAALGDQPLDKFTMANFVRQCMQAYDMSLGGQDPGNAVDNIEDTF